MAVTLCVSRILDPQSGIFNIQSSSEINSKPDSKTKNAKNAKKKKKMQKETDGRFGPIDRKMRQVFLWFFSHINSLLCLALKSE